MCRAAPLVARAHGIGPGTRVPSKRARRRGLPLAPALPRRQACLRCRGRRQAACVTQFVIGHPGGPCGVVRPCSGPAHSVRFLSRPILIVPFPLGPAHGSHTDVPLPSLLPACTPGAAGVAGRRAPKIVMGPFGVEGPQRPPSPPGAPRAPGPSLLPQHFHQTSKPALAARRAIRAGACPPSSRMLSPHASRISLPGAAAGIRHPPPQAAHPDARVLESAERPHPRSGPPPLRALLFSLARPLVEGHHHQSPRAKAAAHGTPPARRRGRPRGELTAPPPPLPGGRRGEGCVCTGPNAPPGMPAPEGLSAFGHLHFLRSQLLGRLCWCRRHPLPSLRSRPASLPAAACSASLLNAACWLPAPRFVRTTACAGHAHCIVCTNAQWHLLWNTAGRRRRVIMHVMAP